MRRLFGIVDRRTSITKSPRALAWGSKRMGQATGRVLDRWRRSALDLLFPPACAFCRIDIPATDSSRLLCADCRDRLFAPSVARCAKCGCPSTREAVSKENCPRCRNERFHFDTVLTLGSYQADLRDAILRMKHRHEQPLAMAMGQLLAQRVVESMGTLRPDVIVPMPIHWLRRLSRGSSGPEVMAESAAAKLAQSLAPNMLMCLRATKKQSMLTPERRRRNVKGAFRIRPGHSCRGLYVMLVDDVVTTGATASEAAAVLRRGGASRISVVVVARATGVD